MVANKRQLEALKTGMAAWDEWCERHPRAKRDFRGADLRGAELGGFDLRRADFSDADLSSADLEATNLSCARLQGANLAGAKLNNANLNEIDFSGMDLRGVWFHEANCTWTNFSEANLEEAEFLNATLIWADFTSAQMPYAAFNDACLSEARLYKAMFFDTDFSGAEFREADLRNVKGRRSSFAGARLSKARMQHADLRLGSFTGANLVDADLSKALLQGASLSEANLTRAKLTGADLRGADLSGAILVHARIDNADLSGARVYGIAAWDMSAAGSTQNDLIITSADHASVRVDDIEIAQFVYLLLNHEKLRSVLNSVTDRGVLLLGRFRDGGLELLQAIAATLRDLNYLPIIFDFERPGARNYTETVKTLAGLSRFIIADLSGVSVPQELTATVPFFKIPLVPVIEAGRTVYSMFADILEYPWVLPPVTFSDTEDLLALLPSRVVEPAEVKHAERQMRLDALFKS
jgi:uncharacterized protein YjbI with pentapeptide repeats